MSHVLHVLKTKVNVRVFFWNKFSLLDTFGYMHMCYAYTSNMVYLQHGGEWNFDLKRYMLKN